MPALTRWFVKTALAYLVLALIVGVGVRAPGVVELPSILGGLSPVHVHLLTVGWVTQVIIGVALWMFPRQRGHPTQVESALAWGVYVTLNAGLAIRAVAEPMHLAATDGPWGWLLVASAVLQWVAGMAFVAIVWPRVKGR